MKKIIYLEPLAVFCLLSFFILNCAAQCLPPSGNARLDGNNIDALFKTNGTHFFTNSGDAVFIVPKGSGKSTIFSSSLWLGGKDEQDQLHLAAMMYEQMGNDFWSGPVSNAADAYYDRFWKISKEEIEYHKLHYTDQYYEVPSSIANWPAHGRNEYGESAKLAPYKSISGNSSYTPSLGDYPLIRGDQALFWINNDACNAHGESGGDPLDIEIMSMAYVYNTPDNNVLQHTIFLSYEIRNKSTHNYKDFYVGYFADFDIGYGYDDYIGCDTLLNLAYGYNGKEKDGNGESHAYGEHPPAQGAMFLNQKMNAFMCFSNDNTSTGNPMTTTHYYNYLQAKWKDNTPLTLWGSGYNPESTDYTNFAFSGNPATEDGWIEAAPGQGYVPNAPGDRRGLMNVGPFTLLEGESICIDLALPFARDMEGNNVSSVALLKQHVQTIQQFYNAQNYENSCAENVDISENKHYLDKIFIYPNPSNGRFTITCEKIIESIELYNVLGEKVFFNTPKMQTTQISVDLSKGLYIYRAVLQDNSIISGKIIVQ